MLTKRPNVYALYLYTQIKCKSLTVYIKNKKGGGAYQRELFALCFQRIKKTKLNKEGWDNRRKLFKLYKHNKICFLFPCLFYFSSDKLAKHT